jgi:hypothetical protein
MYCMIDCHERLVQSLEFSSAVQLLADGDEAEFNCATHPLLDTGTA